MNYLVTDKTDKKNPTETTVGLQEIGEGIYEITIDDRTIHVDAVKSGPNIYSILEDGKQFEVMVDETGQHGFDILAGGGLFHLESVDERTRLLAAAGMNVAVGKQVVQAEMPGKVVSVSVKVGAEVVAGQGLVILEAMKMENEIQSPIDGTVTEVGVTDGQTVEDGAMLFVVEPPEAEGA